MKDKISYTLGFILYQEYVLLIEKQKPEFQKGFYNGLGGKVEPLESNEDCIIREIQEECKLTTTKEDWIHFCTMSCPTDSKDNISNGWDVFCFITKINPDQFLQVEKAEAEKIRWVPIHQINPTSSLLLGNIMWLVGMGLDTLKNKAFIPPTITYTGLSLPYKL